MTKPLHFGLLVLLLTDGGSVAPPSGIGSHFESARGEQKSTGGASREPALRRHEVAAPVQDGNPTPPVPSEHSDGGPTGSASADADAGSIHFSSSHAELDGGTVDSPPRPFASDATPLADLPDGGQAINWPKDLRPLATLNGSAIVAANAALQRVLELFPKEHRKNCAYSARAMEVLVGEQGGLYFVRVNWRLDNCGRAPPGFNPAFDWFELYAVSPDGRIIERYPYYP